MVVSVRLFHADLVGKAPVYQFIKNAIVGKKVAAEGI